MSLNRGIQDFGSCQHGQTPTPKYHDSTARKMVVPGRKIGSLPPERKGGHGYRPLLQDLGEVANRPVSRIHNYCTSMMSCLTGSLSSKPFPESELEGLVIISEACV